MLRHCQQSYRIIQKSRNRLITSSIQISIDKELSSIRKMSSTIKSPFPKWPNPVHDAEGDYRTEAAFLETKLHTAKNNLYMHQKSIPRLPLPSISDTLSKLAPTVLPLVKHNENEKTSFLQAIEDFPSQVAQLHLQERLEKRRNKDYSNSSWLQHWWNTLGYLDVRDPVVINVSYFYHFQTDPTLPTTQHEDLSIPRTAAILTKLAKLRQEICGATFPPPSVGRKTPVYLCNTQYKYAFHTCRIPKLNRDVYRMYDPSLAEHSHCLIIHRGQYYAMDFVDPETGEPLPLKLLEQRLKKIKQMEAQENKISLGWLTSWNRDSWAKGRNSLLAVGGTDMEQALAKLESAAFAICLDDETPVSKNECATQFLHGSMHSGGNRWFDKSLQFIVTPNGQAGMNGEHSMMDGMPTTHLAGIVAGYRYEDASSEQTPSVPTIDQLDANDGIEDIFAKCHHVLATNPKIATTIIQAKSDFQTLTEAHAIQAKQFYGYGSNFMKANKFSPDAYVQMAMQLATYRLFKEQVGTYEATQTRMFLHGRTEVSRAVSTESEAFVKAMGLHPHMSFQNKSQEIQQKVTLLRNAAAAHAKYTSQAAKGMGVDRHLFGLSQCVKDGEPMPDLLSHPLFVRSKHWRVSTSHLTHPNFVNWGYGEVVPDGVGLSYAIHKDYCHFNVTALKEHKWAEKLGDLLEDALLEMRSILEMDNEKIVARSKL